MRKQSILKVGNSLGVSIPAIIVKRLGLSPGQTVYLTVKEDMQLMLEFPDAKQKQMLYKKSDPAKDQ